MLFYLISPRKSWKGVRDDQVRVLQVNKTRTAEIEVTELNSKLVAQLKLENNAGLLSPRSMTFRLYLSLFFFFFLALYILSCQLTEPFSFQNWSSKKLNS